MSMPVPPNTVPWAPEDLPATQDDLRGGWSYTVLEELVDELALLRRWPWPLVDQNGRLIWPGGAEQDTHWTTVPVELLRAQLYLPNRLVRTPRCGDTFAEWAGTSRWRRRAVRDVRELFDGTVYDISAAAREAAKIAYLGGVAAVEPAHAEDDETRGLVAEDLTARAGQPLPALVIAAPPAPEANPELESLR
ncbi:MAG: hypothetical protein ABIP57_02930 [Jatrophihabitantaceae bacterium]